MSAWARNKQQQRRRQLKKLSCKLLSPFGCCVEKDCGIEAASFGRDVPLYQGPQPRGWNVLVSLNQ